jgi:hypothetical protein
VENVDDHVGPAVQQNKMAANHDVGAIGRRRRQAPFEFFGTRLEAFLETWRERAALHKLLFQPRRQFIPLGEPGRKATAVAAIPVANDLTVVIFIKMFTLIVVVFVVTFPMTLD